jgi:hypothetical protein
VAEGSQFELAMPFAICEKALLDIGPEKNGAIEQSFRDTELSSSLIAMEYGPFAPQIRHSAPKTPESPDCVAEDAVTSELISVKNREKYREYPGLRTISSANFAETT